MRVRRATLRDGRVVEGPASFARLSAHMFALTDAQATPGPEVAAIVLEALDA